MADNYHLNSMYIWPVIKSPAGAHPHATHAGIAEILVTKLFAAHLIELSVLTAYVATAVAAAPHVAIPDVSAAVRSAANALILAVKPANDHLLSDNSIYYEIGTQRHEARRFFGKSNAAGEPVLKEFTIEYQSVEYVVTVQFGYSFTKVV